MREVDVAVIGGGIIGSAVAYFAAKRGLRVALVDQPRRGRATSASAGGLWPIGESVGLGCGVIFHKAQAANGGTNGHGNGHAPGAATFPGALPRCFFDFAMQSNAMAPGVAAELLDLCGIDVEWERTSLLFVLGDSGDEAFAHFVRDRLPDADRLTQWLSPEELAREEPAVTREARGALRFFGDDQVNPYRLADAFRASAGALGASVHSHAEVTGLRVEKGRVVAVETREGAIPCTMAVNAAGAWAPQIGRMVGLEIPVRPVRGQILGTETLPKGTLRACLSTSDCYLAQKGHGEIIIGSTTEEVGFATDVTPAALHTLAAGAVKAMPSLETVRLKRTWAGLRPGTPDELPILGPVEGVEGYFNACGHFRTGILNAPLTGLVLSEMLVGEPPSVPIEPFLLSRFAAIPKPKAEPVGEAAISGDRR